MFKKPDDEAPPLSKIIDPITPIDEELLRKIRKAASNDEEFDPIEEQPTSEMKAISRTSGSMRAFPPHTIYVISPDLDIFGETQNAVCKHIRTHRWNIPKGIIMPPPIHERLEFDMLTPKPFNETYLFIIAGMDKVHFIPVYLDLHVGISLPHDTIMCLLS